MKQVLIIFVCFFTVQCFILTPLPSSLEKLQPAKRNVILRESLAEGLFKQAFGGLSGLSKSGMPQKPLDPAAKAKLDEVASIDARAKSGEVTFTDFLQIGRTFRAFDGKVPGMPGTLTPQQIKETMEKFDKHEKIVDAMLDEERATPQLLIDDLNNTKEKCPRVQRLARVSGVDERSVALFVAEFEAMRQSTQRIAEGEDPDKVNAEIGSSNRAQRRAMKKAEKKKKSART